MKLATVYREQIGIILSVQCQVLSEKTKSDELKNGKLEENIEFQTETIFHLIIRWWWHDGVENDNNVLGDGRWGGADAKGINMGWSKYIIIL